MTRIRKPLACAAVVLLPFIAVACGTSASSDQSGSRSGNGGRTSTTSAASETTTQNDRGLYSLAEGLDVPQGEYLKITGSEQSITVTCALCSDTENAYIAELARKLHFSADVISRMGKTTQADGEQTASSDLATATWSYTVGDGFKVALTAK